MFANKKIENEMMDISRDEEMSEENNVLGNVGAQSGTSKFDLGMESEHPFPFNLSNKKNNTNIGEFSFKNYIPIDKNFPIERLMYFEQITKVEKDYQKKVRRAIKDFINIEKNPLNIVPKKNNIDLKRNLGHKLSKLNRRTEIAILELIKENLSKNQPVLNNNNKQELENENIPDRQGGRDLVNATNKMLELEKNQEYEEDKSDEEDDK